MKVFSILLMFSFFLNYHCYAQDNAADNRADTGNFDHKKLPLRYLKTVNKKIGKYHHRITHKTEKTLTRLSRWENKIHKLLQKADPAAAQQLFGNGQMTFTGLLKRYREGKAAAEGYTAKYDHYRDELATQIKYLEEKKDELTPGQNSALAAGSKDIAALEDNIEESEFIKEFIRKSNKVFYRI